MRIAYATLFFALTCCPLLAQGWRTPVLVIPGRPDVPVFMNGFDVSWSVIEGDFGLDRPIGTVPTVVYRPYGFVAPYYVPGPYAPGRRVYGPRYFPSTGERPGYGRLEVIPPSDRPLPPPAESFVQGWSSQSAPGPVTIYPPVAAPPIIGGGGPGRRRWHHGGPPPLGGAPGLGAPPVGAPLNPSQ
jgi:hypothetical protein